MIPSTTNQLLVAEDWTKIYQSFRNAEFKSYDFETLRRTMINYLRETYPEDFNDYIDSSEYVALIDLIAFLGQNLAFRIELNARENFLETAERRESILRLAKLISYNAKRNVPANGFLKINSVSTTENVFDSGGVNLTNSVIGWNDPTNPNWYQQFVAVINAAMPSPVVFGKPSAKDTIDGITTEQYSINVNSTEVPVYTFSKNISGTQMGFELVSSTFSGKSYVYEAPPLPGGQFGFIFKNDNRGSGSSNTGFFVQFRQGSLGASDFSVSTPVPNELIGVNISDINDTDTWLWQLSPDGLTHQTLWTKVPSLTGNNVIYNSISSDERNIYSILTREADQIDLSFADGSFGDLPNGQFRLYYRQSNGLLYSIKPEQMANISFQIPYRNKSNQSHVLTIIMGLQYTVSNSSSSESNADIQLKAPQTYYTQNRMVTGEDYNIAPLNVNSDIIKVKSINRISSGISKYFELSDVSGKYSTTNIVANDGILYKDSKEYNFEFTYSSRNDVLSIIRNQISPIFESPEFKSFYLEHYPRLETAGLYWVKTNSTTNQTRGYFNSVDGPVMLGPYATGTLAFFVPGTLLKLLPPAGSFFLPNGDLTTIQDETTLTYKWVQIAGVIGDGSNGGVGNLDDGTGPVILTGSVVGNGTIVDSATPVSVIPKFLNSITYSLELEITNLILSKRNFGLSFDQSTRTWYIVSDSNLDLSNAFSLVYQKDITNINKDSSWMMSFEWTGKKFITRYRTTEYIFESDRETAFFIDDSKKNYDFVTDTVIKDQIKVLSVNRGAIPTTSLSTVTTVTPYISTLATTANSEVSTTTDAILYFSTTTGIAAGGQVVIHPNIATGQSFIKYVYPTSVHLYNTLTNAISTGSLVTFVPTSISSTSTVSFTSAETSQNFSIGRDFQWQINSAVVEPDGYIEPKKVLISFFDYNDDGQIDDPDAFNVIVEPDSNNLQTGFRDKFVFFKNSDDGVKYSLYTGTVLSYPTEDDVPDEVKIDGQLYFFYDPDVNVVKHYDESSNSYVLEPSYFARYGRSNLKFQYVHNSGQDRRIDPSKSNIIDVYLLSKAYDIEYKNWLADGVGREPLPPTTQSIEENYAASLEPIKSISDELIFHPAKYKVLFGPQAVPQLQATFKAVTNPARSVTTTDLQTRIQNAIADFFNIDNWSFGQSFNFGELSAYVMNRMTPDIINFVIVPKMDNNFGSLYQISCQSDEIFVNGSTVNDIQIISSLTASELKTTTIVTSS